MPVSIACLRCSTTMELGYVRDRGHNDGVQPAAWVAGDPDMRWYGVRTKGHETVAITAWRCPSCGYVELRAVEG